MQVVSVNAVDVTFKGLEPTTLQEEFTPYAHLLSGQREPMDGW
jgi:hypothetical protein